MHFSILSKFNLLFFSILFDTPPKKEQEQILEQAKQKQNELKLKQQKLLSEAKAQERKDETRRKILLGAWVLNKLKSDESFKHQLADFEQFLSSESKTEENRQKDRELFSGLL